MKKMIAAIGLIAFFQLVPACAEPRHYRLDPAESQVTFTGNSGLHRFSGTTSDLTGEMQADPRSGTLLDMPLVRVPVGSLKTGNEARDHAVQYTLKAKKHPSIMFRLTKAVSLDTGSPEVMRYRLTGELIIGGAARSAEIEAGARFEADNIRVEGATTLTLDGFGLKPPPLARVLGVRNEVPVRFETLWKPEEGRG